jgi:hypothetical protein
MNLRSKASMLGLAILIALASPVLAAEKGFLWDGNHWRDMAKELKVAYLKGVGNMADFEVGTGLGARAMCISKGFVDELKTRTVVEIIAEVDNFYKENPGKMNTPVIEVILRKCTKLCPVEPTEEKKK